MLFVIEGVNCFMCGDCGRSYKYKHSLQNNQEFECEVLPTFVCNLCFKQFLYRGDLRIHLLIIHKTD